MNKIIIFILFALINTSCTFTSLENSEKKYNETVKKTILIHMDLETMFPDEQHRSLAKAAGKGNISKVDDLISLGVDVNARGNGNATALFWAMRSKKGFEHLLKLGADSNVIFDDGGTVLHWLARKNDCSMLITALKYGGNPNLKAGMFYHSPIFETITIGKNEGTSPCFNALLDYGVDINSVDGNGQSPLLSAADLTRYDIVYSLLKRGANYSIEDDFGRDINTFIESHEGQFISESDGEKFRMKSKELLIKYKDNRD